MNDEIRRLRKLNSSETERKWKNAIDSKMTNEFDQKCAFFSDFEKEWIEKLPHLLSDAYAHGDIHIQSKLSQIHAFGDIAIQSRQKILLRYIHYLGFDMEFVGNMIFFKD